jgi:hypothetical protein
MMRVSRGHTCGYLRKKAPRMTANWLKPQSHTLSEERRFGELVLVRELRNHDPCHPLPWIGRGLTTRIFHGAYPLWRFLELHSRAGAHDPPATYHIIRTGAERVDSWRRTGGETDADLPAARRLVG